MRSRNDSTSRHQREQKVFWHARKLGLLLLLFVCVYSYDGASSFSRFEDKCSTKSLVFNALMSDVTLKSELMVLVPHFDPSGRDGEGSIHGTISKRSLLWELIRGGLCVWNMHYSAEEEETFLASEIHECVYDNETFHIPINVNPPWIYFATRVRPRTMQRTRRRRDWSTEYGMRTPERMFNMHMSSILLASFSFVTSWIWKRAQEFEWIMQPNNSHFLHIVRMHSLAVFFPRWLMKNFPFSERFLARSMHESLGSMKMWGGGGDKIDRKETYV